MNIIKKALIKGFNVEVLANSNISYKKMKALYNCLEVGYEIIPHSEDLSLIILKEVNNEKDI